MRVAGNVRHHSNKQASCHGDGCRQETEKVSQGFVVIEAATAASSTAEAASCRGSND
jgi:hypothetical protein